MSFSSFITINKLHIEIAEIMKINELLLESKQLDEGPITQAIGRGVGKVAKGVSNIGRELKTGFKAGYNDQSTDNSPAEPKRDSAAMQGVKSGLNKALGAKAFDVNPRVPSAQQAVQNQQATTPNINRPASAPVKNVADFGTIQRSIKTLSPRQKAALVAQLSGKPAKQAPTQAEIDADRERIMGPNSGESTVRTATPISEGFSLYRKH